MARTEYSPDCELPRSPRARRYTRRTYMSVTRAAALRRLVSKWLEANSARPGKGRPAAALRNPDRRQCRGRKSARPVRRV